MLKNRLKQIRLNMAAEQGRDISQTEFAAMLGYDKYIYNRWETQKVQPNLETAIVLSNKLNTTVNELFEIVSE